MSFRAHVRSIEAACRAAGISVPMAKLRDAIARALTGKAYSAAVAAEAAGKLPELIRPAPFLEQVCRDYRLDPLTFAAALEGADAAGLREALPAPAPQEESGAEEPASRTQARALCVAGTLSVPGYAAWIVEHADPQDAAEAELDAAIDGVSLWIHDSGARTAEIERGCAAADAALRERRVTVGQAYLAVCVEEAGGEPIAAHRAAWREAECSAAEAAFAGWARHPEGWCLGPA